MVPYSVVGFYKHNDIDMNCLPTIPCTLNYKYQSDMSFNSTQKTQNCEDLWWKAVDASGGGNLSDKYAKLMFRYPEEVALSLPCATIDANDQATSH